MKHAFLIMTAAALLVTACTPEYGDTPPVALMAEESFDYDSVFVQDSRPESDFEQYELRHSREILAFTGVQPGMTVLDMEAGDGIYTELFSLVVGEEGKVYLQNPPEFEVFLGDAVERRMDGRLRNVTHIQTSFDDFEPIGDQEVDLVTHGSLDHTSSGTHRRGLNPERLVIRKSAFQRFRESSHKAVTSS